jgi:hypothetical protein
MSKKYLLSAVFTAMLLLGTIGPLLARVNP